MEDIRRRIEFENTAVKVQAIQKLLTAVSNKIDKDTPIDNKTQETVEIKLLWEKCADADVTVSRVCCEAVFSLVQHGLAEFDYVMQGLLNLVPMAKSISGICATVCDLLVLHQMAALTQSGKYTCPYGIRDPPHPLVTIVTGRPDMWEVMLQNVIRIIQQGHKRAEDTSRLLSPLVHFLLLEPPQSPQFLPARLSLVPALLQPIRDKDDTNRLQAIWRIVDVLCHAQLLTTQNVSEPSQHVTSVLHTLLSDLGVTSDLTTFDLQTTQTVASLTLSLCRVGMKFGLDPSQMLTILLRLCDLCPESLQTEKSLLHLVDLMQALQGKDLKPVLKLVLVWLDKKSSKHTNNSLMNHILILPLLQVVSMPTVSITPDSSLQTMTSKIIRLLKTQLQTEYDKEDTTQEKTYVQSGLTTDESLFKAIDILVQQFNQTTGKAFNWLSSIQSGIRHLDDVPYHVTCLVASLFVVTEDENVMEKSLDVLVEIVKKSEHQSPCMLPLLLYKLSEVKDADTKLVLLKALPRMVTSKLAVAPVLRSLQVLGANPKLKALSMTLLSSLWQQEDRCFPYLQHHLVDNSKGSTLRAGIDDTLLARAACIRDVCKNNPHQHGSSILSPLSDILNQATAPDVCSPVCLVLEGLFYLCESEVLDIQTAWSVLAAKMASEKRPLVLASVCQLLSLVPELSVDTEEYKTFASDVLNLLWMYTQSLDDKVASAAYGALAKFSQSDFNLRHFPEHLTSSLLPNTEDDSEEEPETSPDVPGDLYVQLVRGVKDGVSTDLQTFLCSMVQKEVSVIPRGVHQAANKRKVTNQNKALTGIPAFLGAELERNKTPGLRSALAVGVLHSYDPPVATGRDNKPRPHQIIQHGRGYHQMLYTLLHESPLPVGDWHQSLSLPQGWVSFMERCLHAYAQGQRMELAQQLERGQASDPCANEQQQRMAYSRARDKLVDLVENASSGSPSVQANCLLALSGLVVAFTKYYNSLDDKERQMVDNSADHHGYAHWFTIAMETLMSILDNTFVTKGDIFNMCQLRSAACSRQPCPALSRCGAALALSSMVPVITASTHTAAVYTILSVLSDRLPGRDATECQPAVDFYMPLALGLVLARLEEEHFTETSGQQGMLEVWKGIEALEESAKTAENKSLGSYLGLSVTLVALCSDNKADAREHVSSVQQRLCQTLENMSGTETAYEGVCLCLAAVTGSCYLATILSQDSVDQVVGRLYQAHCDQPQVSGVTLALGHICYLLLLANHPTVGDLSIKLYGSWISGIQEDLPTLQRLSYLKGIFGLCGSEKLTYNILADTVTSQSGVTLSEVTKMTQALVRDGDLGLAVACSWQLGQLYRTSETAGHTRLCVPLTYHYLPETSIIRAMVDELLEAGKHGTSKVAENTMVSLLQVLCDGPTTPLPPLNWAGVLSPVLRMNYGHRVEQWSLELASRQSLTSSSAGLLMSTWLLSPLWGTIQFETKLAILRNLPKLIKSVPLGKLKDFFSEGFMEPFSMLSSRCQKIDVESHELFEICQVALGGLLAALRVPDHPHMTSLLLHQTVEGVYGYLPKNVQIPLYTTFCLCLAELPDDLIDKVTSKDFCDLEQYQKCLFVRCFLVANGCQPLTWINDAVEAYMCKTESDSAECLQYLVGSFHTLCRRQSESVSTSKQHMWVLEVMGHVRNLTTGVVPITGLEAAQVVEFMLLVFASAVISWCGSDAAQLVIAPIDLSQPPQLSETCDVPRSETDVKFHIDVQVGNLLWAILPQCLEKLVTRDPWKQSTGKIIDWLIVLCQCDVIRGSPKLRHNLKSCLFALRHTQAFKKMSVWSKAFGILEN